MTVNTIVNSEQLRGEIERIREQGFSMDFGEVEVSEHCVSAPVRGRQQQVVAAIAIMGPADRLTPRRMRECAPIVKAIASTISAEVFSAPA